MRRGRDVHIRVDPAIGGAPLPSPCAGDTVLLRLLAGEPHGRGLLAADHEVDVVLSPEAVSHRAQEAVGIWRQVHARRLGLEVEDGADEAGVLVRETVVLLPCPGGGLDVVERSVGLAP